MAIIEINSTDLPELAPYASLTESGLRRRDIIIAESPKVIERALEAGLKPISLLCEKRHIDGDAAEIISRFPEMTVFTGEREILADLTGYTLTRGVLCAFQRPMLPNAGDLLKDARRVCVIYDVCDVTNIGVIFRSAAALGYDAVLLSPTSCDPFIRRAARVSMGAVFQIPWSYDTDVLKSLKKHGFKSVCTALRKESIPLHDFEVKQDEKYAVILGSEGYGLPSEIIDGSDYIVRIPMHRNVDSLNVGAAAAIVLYSFI